MKRAVIACLCALLCAQAHAEIILSAPDAIGAGLTGEIIPEGTLFALRVFGRREADACRTDLEISMGPLDETQVDLKIQSVQAMNLAKTPIARSLELVADDLREATGERAVVLITDGEETCDGDPAAAIESLREAGIDVRIDIVGFAIEDESLKSNFRYWADLGGGDYYDATNADDLSRSMARAVRAKFEVRDAEGVVVASGSVGDEKIQLPAGLYRVTTSTASSPFRDVEVESEKETTVVLSP